MRLSHCFGSGLRLKGLNANRTVSPILWRVMRRNQGPSASSVMTIARPGVT